MCAYACVSFTPAYHDKSHSLLHVGTTGHFAPTCCTPFEMILAHYQLSHLSRPSCIPSLENANQSASKLRMTWVSILNCLIWATYRHFMKPPYWLLWNSLHQYWLQRAQLLVDGPHVCVLSGRTGSAPSVPTGCPLINSAPAPPQFQCIPHRCSAITWLQHFDELVEVVTIWGTVPAVRVYYPQLKGGVSQLMGSNVHNVHGYTHKSPPSQDTNPLPDSTIISSRPEDGSQLQQGL